MHTNVETFVQLCDYVNHQKILKTNYGVIFYIYHNKIYIKYIVSDFAKYLPIAVCVAIHRICVQICIGFQLSIVDLYYF